MSSAIERRTANISLVSSSSTARARALAAREKIRFLKHLAIEMQRELEALTQVPTPTVEQGIDFYAEVSRFERKMIRCALEFADGHQGIAAQLLNLKTTTLHAMIKRYHIQRPTSVTRTEKEDES